MRYWTADLHFRHHNIITYCNRPFADVDEMDVALIDRWNNVVGHDDEVWIVGDLAMGRLTDSLPLIGRLHGHLVLIPGNHDRPWPGHRKGVERGRAQYLEAGIDEILDPQVTTRIGTHTVTVCHFPYAGDSHDKDRYREHRPVDRGQWLIHGHVHDRWQVQGRQINVGADVWGYRPISDTTIQGIIEAGR